MPNNLVFDWNGQDIRFDDWADNAFGRFDYTSRDLNFDFSFDIKEVGDEVRIYIVSQPSYGARSQDLHTTHRIWDRDRHMHYVCVDQDLEPGNVPDALSWMIYWAENTAEYIRSGRRFS